MHAFGGWRTHTTSESLAHYSRRNGTQRKRARAQTRPTCLAIGLLAKVQVRRVGNWQTDRSASSRARAEAASGASGCRFRSTKLSLPPRNSTGASLSQSPAGSVSALSTCNGNPAERAGHSNCRPRTRVIVVAHCCRHRRPATQKSALDIEDDNYLQTTPNRPEVDRREISDGAELRPTKWSSMLLTTKRT